MKDQMIRAHALLIRPICFAILLFPQCSTVAATIWNGPTITFSESTTDTSDPDNQDRITDQVWITRGGTEGIFNIAQEPGFTHFSSPKDTMWADGTLDNPASLNYTDWNTWAKLTHSGPPSTVGVNAVMHLVSDDIYIAVKFTFWGGSGGLFTYQRTTPPTAPVLPTLASTQIGNKLVLTWTNATFSLQSATNAAGPYTTITNAVSPFTNTIVGTRAFFRLKK